MGYVSVSQLRKEGLAIKICCCQREYRRRESTCQWITGAPTITKNMPQLGMTSPEQGDILRWVGPAHHRRGRIAPTTGPTWRQPIARLRKRRPPSFSTDRHPDKFSVRVLLLVSDLCDFLQISTSPPGLCVDAGRPLPPQAWPYTQATPTHLPWPRRCTRYPICSSITELEKTRKIADSRPVSLPKIYDRTV